MNGVQRRQGSLKRRWDEDGGPCNRAIPFPMRLTPAPFGAAASASSTLPTPSTSKKLLGFSPLHDETASAVVPPVTVVFEGRSICHRIHLQNHASYESLAAALRRMFVDTDIGGDRCAGDGEACGPSLLDLSNAVPGHIVAYEDMEDDLLLAGDLKWNDFVRVAKRIRILPAKASRRKHCGGAAAV